MNQSIVMKGIILFVLLLLLDIQRSPLNFTKRFLGGYVTSPPKESLQQFLSSDAFVVAPSGLHSCSVSFSAFVSSSLSCNVNICLDPFRWNQVRGAIRKGGGIGKENWGLTNPNLMIRRSKDNEENEESENKSKYKNKDKKEDGDGKGKRKGKGKDAEEGNEDDNTSIANGFMPQSNNKKSTSTKYSEEIESFFETKNIDVEVDESMMEMGGNRKEKPRHRPIRRIDITDVTPSLVNEYMLGHFQEPLVIENAFHSLDFEDWIDSLMTIIQEKEINYQIQHTDRDNFFNFNDENKEVSHIRSTVLDFVMDAMAFSTHDEAYYLLDENLLNVANPSSREGESIAKNNDANFHLDLIRENKHSLNLVDMTIAHELRRVMQLPKQICEEDNLFHHFPKQLKPADYCIIMAGKGGRSFLHADPMEWIGWNLSLEGQKQWIFLNPYDHRNERNGDKISGNNDNSRGDTNNNVNSFIARNTDSCHDYASTEEIEKKLKTYRVVPNAWDAGYFNLSAGWQSNIDLFYNDPVEVIDQSQTNLKEANPNPSDFINNDYIESLIAQKGLSEHLYIGTQKEGDLVLIPPRWYHQVYSLENSFAIASQYTNNLNKYQVYKHILEWSNQHRKKAKSQRKPSIIKGDENDSRNISPLNSRYVPPYFNVNSVNDYKPSARKDERSFNVNEKTTIESTFDFSSGNSSNDSQVSWNLLKAKQRPWTSSAWAALLEIDKEEEEASTSKHSFPSTFPFEANIHNNRQSRKTMLERNEGRTFTGATTLPSIEISIFQNLLQSKNSSYDSYLERGKALNRFLSQEGSIEENNRESYVSKDRLVVKNYNNSDIDSEILAQNKKEKQETTTENIYNIFNVASIKSKVNIKEEIHQVLYNALISRYGYEEGETRYRKLVK